MISLLPFRGAESTMPHPISPTSRLSCHQSLSIGIGKEVDEVVLLHAAMPNRMHQGQPNSSIESPMATSVSRNAPALKSVTPAV
jgi:hypothetical protein